MSNVMEATDRIQELYRSSKLTPINIEESLYVLNLGYEDRDLQRIRYLQDKIETPEITKAERRELEQLVQLGTILSTLQSRARLALRQAGVAKP